MVGAPYDFVGHSAAKTAFTLHDVELDVGGEAAEGFPEHQRFSAEALGGGLVEVLSYYGEGELCVDSGVQQEPESSDIWNEGGQASRKSGDSIRHVPQFPDEAS